mmetsp:Transcript_24/g.84  ORF Transcript_24/g.84 Transcript_24/m.84 type:complete len:206 (-) Transcript_24:299-916(-)
MTRGEKRKKAGSYHRLPVRRGVKEKNPFDDFDFEAALNDVDREESAAAEGGKEETVKVGEEQSRSVVLLKDLKERRRNCRPPTPKTSSLLAHSTHLVHSGMSMGRSRSVEKESGQGGEEEVGKQGVGGNGGEKNKVCYGQGVKDGGEVGEIRVHSTNGTAISPFNITNQISPAKKPRKGFFQMGKIRLSMLKPRAITRDQPPTLY